MSGDERKLIASLGQIDAAIQAVNLALMSGGYGETDLSRLEEIDDDVAALIASLANLSALLARTLAHALGQPRDNARTILTTIRDDQEVRAARESLAELDNGLPFDA